MTVTTDALAVSIEALLRGTSGVVRLYPPAGKVPLLAGAVAAVQAATGQPQPLVAVSEDTSGATIRASLGITADVVPVVLLRELTAAIRSRLEGAEPAAAPGARIDLTVVHIAS